MAEFSQEQAQLMYDALKNLAEICGEANIPLVSVKAVRKMARFIDAKQAADSVLDGIKASISLTAVTETEIQAGQHKWTGCRRGGSPAEADSYEWVRYCEVCGMEDTCEDPLPPCEGA